MPRDGQNEQPAPQPYNELELRLCVSSFMCNGKGWGRRGTCAACVEMLHLGLEHGGDIALSDSESDE